MIVTRQRRKPFRFRKFILPIVALAVLIFALLWPPSHAMIFNGPLAPMWGSAGSAYDKVAMPFHFAAQNELLTDRNKQIVALQAQVASDKTALAAKDKQITQIQTQLDQAATTQAAARSAVPLKPAAGASTTPGGVAPAAQGTFVVGDLSAGATPDMRRTAAYWAAMNPDNAAKVVQKLPVPYVARVLALMSTDGAGAILDALPAAYAAQLTQEDPRLQR